MRGTALLLAALCFSGIHAGPKKGQTDFELTGETVVVSDKGAILRLKFRSLERMNVHWKKIVEDPDDGRKFWIPIEGNSKVGYVRNKLKKTKDAFEGVALLRLRNEEYTPDIIATFYNEEGNVLYEYIPNAKKAQKAVDVKNQLEKGKGFDDKFNGVELVEHPPVIHTIKEGGEAKATCVFRSPKDADARVEWVKVNYHNVNGTKFFSKEVEVLKSEDEWFVDHVAVQKDLQVSIERSDEGDAGTLITTALKINKMKPEFEGVYTCHLVEQKVTPYTYVSAFTEILPSGRASMLETNTVSLKLFLCQDMYEVIPQPAYTIKEGLANCFSCGGYGYPRPNMELYKDGQKVSANDPRIKVMNMGLDVQVLMYSLTNPTEEDSGQYTCRAERGDDTTKWDFELSVGELAEHDKIEDETEPEINTEETLENSEELREITDALESSTEATTTEPKKQ